MPYLGKSKEQRFFKSSILEIGFHFGLHFQVHNLIVDVEVLLFVEEGCRTVVISEYRAV
jgi:hypothetical protein